MFDSCTAIASLAVSDINRAKTFYQGALGFPGTDDESGGFLCDAGEGSHFLVYPSSFAGTNKATAMALRTTPDAFDAQVQALRSHGLSFDTFEYPGVTWDDGVASIAGQRAVWFRDPDGNILALETAP